ncbi:MAG: sigma-70 family RNA polymerase sigma factor [Subdoligranulum variabile]|nr:sigma-70 family RNA polymerase sigma factor [Subdoligranulum variabile]
MNGSKNFHTNLKNQPNEPVGERVVSERGRKELPPSTRGGENLKPNRYYEHKQHAFDSYCKKVLKCEACNGYRQISRHQKRFASLEELSESDVAQLAVYDRYSWEYTAFPVGNAVVLIENDRLAEALLRLSPKDLEIFMMHWFLWMTDEQIAKCMGMARRTVNTRRYKAYRLLKKLMGGEADD